MDLVTIEKAGGYIAKSGLFGVKTPEQAIALMLVAQAEGRNAFEAARDYHIIDGRPTLKAEAMLARFQQAGGKVKWLVSNDAECSAVFSHPQGGELTIKWTMDRANAAGLAGKNNWKSYPAQMLRARTISEGVRAVFPGACSGMYTPEEIQDLSGQGDVETEIIEERVDSPPEKIEPKPAEALQHADDWNELQLKNRAKELINTKAVDDKQQRELWARSGQNWQKLVELLEELEEPIF